MSFEIETNDNSEVFTGTIKIQSEEIPYAYFPLSCNMEHILNMMQEWKLELPKIMLLIISDNTLLRRWDSHKEQSNFVKGLIKASNATSMWIFTSGLNIGISKVIADAFQEDYKKRNAQICIRHAKDTPNISKMPLIGLCSDAILTYQFVTSEKIIHLQNEGNSLIEQKFNLNPYHTNFLIVRDESCNKDSSSQFLLNLVETLRSTKVSESREDSTILPKSPVPIVAVLIQGNWNTVLYILAHLKQQLPVLVIKGSGGLADVFAYAYNETLRCSQKIKDKDYVETILRRGLNDKITSTFPDLKDNKMAQNLLCERLLECIEFSKPPSMKYITVLNISDLTCNLENLPCYLLEVLFKARQKEALSKHDQLRKDLQLTLDWMQPEIALTKVFYEDPTFEIDKDIFEQAFLQKGCEQFVSLFLDNGFEVHKYLDADTLIKLFQNSLKNSFFVEVCWEGLLARRKIVKLDTSFIDSDLNSIIESLIGIPITVKAEELNNAAKEIFDKNSSKEHNIEVATQRALMILIVWALTSEQAELAIVLWRHTEHPIMTALFASCILDKMKYLISTITIKEEITDISKKFASMAVGVFDLCYNDLPSKAYDSLNIKLVEWTALSLIDMASLAGNKTFVAHPCCQKWLTNKFLGNIKFKELSWGFITFPNYIKVILCAFLVFPMHLWVRFKEEFTEDFVGSDEFGKTDPYYILDPEESKYMRLTREEVKPTHLLQYHYPPAWQMIYYFWSAPITKFWVSHIFYILYLALFTYAVLSPSCGNVILDTAVCLWTLLIAVDSMYRLYSIHKGFPNIPLFASCLEITYILFFVLFYYLLRILNAEEFRDPYTGKILICIGLIYFYYRMIFIYLPISSTLGPLLYQVKTMISEDFMNYLKFVMFILMGNAIAIQAILYPDYPLIPELIRKSFHRAMVIFFITPVDELKGTGRNCVKWEQKPSTEIMCRVSSYVDGTCSDGITFWAYVIVFQFVLLMKLVLMTVLFALFNATGARIGAEADLIWKFQRYNLIIDFSNTLRLPPPLNIFSVLIIICRFIKSCCRKCICFVKQEKKVETISEADGEESLNSKENSYWRKLANEYCALKNQDEKETDYLKRELDVLSQLHDDLQRKEVKIFRSKAQIRQLESYICQTHAHLETLKYRIKKEDTKEICFHSLSRESPYHQTKVKRFLVPEKYVPWEVTWLHYEPIFYTMPKQQYPKHIQPYVDEDIMIQTKKKNDQASFKWNMESVDADGTYRNRQSWIKDSNNEPITYKLDKFDLPRNPSGRTGLRGKGALPRWGPNHHVYAIITRYKKSGKSDEDLMEVSDYLEYVEMWFMKKKELSLPGGSAWSENKYEVIQSCFKMDEDSNIWETSEEMTEFFKDHAMGFPKSEESESEDEESAEFTSKLVHCGYMDDQLNTDQAWKEVELWHFHYNVWTTLLRCFKANIRWRLLSEDVLTLLPSGQTVLLQQLLKQMNGKITTV